MEKNYNESPHAKEKKNQLKTCINFRFIYATIHIFKKQYKEFNSILLIQHTKHNEVLYIER